MYGGLGIEVTGQETVGMSLKDKYLWWQDRCLGLSVNLHKFPSCENELAYNKCMATRNNVGGNLWAQQLATGVGIAALVAGSGIGIGLGYLIWKR